MIHIGVIGCGQRMRSLVRELSVYDKVRIDCVFDPQASQVDRLIKETGLTGLALRAGSWQQVAEHRDLDWVLIGSPNAHHARQAVSALRSGRHVFLEKPLAVTREECLELVNVWNLGTYRLATGFVLRWSPLYRKMKDLLGHLDFGPVISFQACEHISYAHGSYMMRSWRRRRDQAGSFVLEKCVHDLDLIQWMTGTPVTAVAALAGRDLYTLKNRDLLSPREDPYWEEKGNLELSHPFSDEPGSVEDHVSSLITCASGLFGTFQASAGSALPLRRLSLQCLTGWIEAELYSGTLRYRTCSMDAQQVLSWSFTDLHGGGDGPLAAGLYRSMVSRDDQRDETAAGIQATMAGIALGESIESGEWVDIAADLAAVGLLKAYRERSNCPCRYTR